MQFVVTYCGRATASTDEELEGHLEEVMDNLVDLEEKNGALADADMSAAVATGEVELSLLVESDSPENAMELAMGAFRTAIHAAGGHTPGWEQQAHNGAWAMEYTGSMQRLAIAEIR